MFVVRVGGDDADQETQIECCQKLGNCKSNLKPAAAYDDC
jgi:hypothetical protein